MIKPELFFLLVISMYYIPQSPYLLVVFGLFAAITSGLAFEASLKQKAINLSQTTIGEESSFKETLDIFIPFLGICCGTLLFLTGGLGLFGVKLLVSAVISLPITALIGWLIWYQLIIVLSQIQAGGSKAIDLDAYE